MVFSSLEANQRLYANDYVQSPDRRFMLIYQTDGDLVLYRTGGDPICQRGLWAQCPDMWKCRLTGTSSCTTHFERQSDTLVRLAIRAHT